MNIQKHESPFDSPPLVRVLDSDSSTVANRADWIRAIGWNCESYTCAQQYLLNFKPEVHGCNLVAIDEFRDLEVLLESMNKYALSTTVGLVKNLKSTLASQALLAGAFAVQDKFSDAAELEQTLRKAIQRDHKSRMQLQRQGQLAEILESLTSLEHQIIELVIIGHSNKMIAKHCAIGLRTVEKRRHDIVEKFQAINMAEVIRLVTEVTVLQKVSPRYICVA